MYVLIDDLAAVSVDIVNASELVKGIFNFGLSLELYNLKFFMMDSFIVSRK